MFALLFIAAVWLGMGLAYYRTTQAARRAGRPITWRPVRFAASQLPAFEPHVYPTIGPATAATGGLDPASFIADAGYNKKDSPLIF